jgi:3-methyl-2-oxobutanoate hydroxymethyltransferase
MSLARLAELKRAGKKIVAVVAWDTPMARIADAAGVDLVSVGDSVGVNLWGQKEGEITLDELLVVAKAVRRGVKRALLSVDVPPGGNALRLARESNADMIKVLGTPEEVKKLSKQIPVFAEMHGDKGKPEELVALAEQLEAAGAVMLDFRHSGPVAGAAVAKAVKIPVIGGLGGGPWLDGRIRRLDVLFGYPPKTDVLQRYIEDVRERRA